MDPSIRLPKVAAAMFGRYSERAQRVIILAQDEARRLNYNYVGTEHLLLGLIREGKGIAGKALQNLGVDLDHVRSETEKKLGRGTAPPSGEIQFTPRGKKVIMDLAIEEARTLGHSYVGTEHFLLALLREGDSAAARVLAAAGADADRVRAQVLKLLGDPQKAGVVRAPAGASTAPVSTSRAVVVASAVVLDDQCRVLLVRRRPGSDVWQVPGGRPLPSEASRDAAARVAREAAGQVISCDRLLWALETLSPRGPSGVRRIDLYYRGLLAEGRREAVSGDVGYFARGEVPPGTALPPGFWEAADAGFPGYDPGGLSSAPPD